MLEELEKRHEAIVINAPSLVDVRPFFWRLHEDGGMWHGHIQYTFFTHEHTKPFSDLPQSSEPYSCEDQGVWRREVDQLQRDINSGVLIPIALMDSVRVYTNKAWDAYVVWGTDLQNRGYFIAGTPGCEGLVWQLAKSHPSADLYGCNSPAMNKRKRVFGGTLRTYYRMSHAK
jgi:hypothetical protein